MNGGKTFYFAKRVALLLLHLLPSAQMVARFLREVESLLPAVAYHRLQEPSLLSLISPTTAENTFSPLQRLPQSRKLKLLVHDHLPQIICSRGCGEVVSPVRTQSSSNVVPLFTFTFSLTASSCGDSRWQNRNAPIRL